jgi:DNA-binding GntR family transcriptional regulator
LVWPPEPLDAANFRGVLELVLNELRERIVSGELAPGQMLRQRELAAELGVSREPIKQAMRVLEAEGLVVSPPRRTATVAPIDQKLVQDVYDVRAALDAVVARRAAALEDAERLQLSDELAGLMRETEGTTARDARRLVALDNAFHLKIYEAAGNEVATLSFKARWIVIGRMMSLVANTGYYARAWEEHVGITSAIRAGDADEAAGLAEKHCKSAAEWLLAHAPCVSTFDQPGAESVTPPPRHEVAARHE